MRRPTRSAPCSSCSTSSTPDTGPRAEIPEPPAQRRGFSFARRRSPPGAEIEPPEIPAPLPEIERPEIERPEIERPELPAPGSAARRSPPGGRHPAPPDVARGPGRSGHPAPPRCQFAAPRDAGPGARGDVARAMFQTNDTTVFSIILNCPILTLKVAYIFLRGPYDETRRPIGRGA